MAEDKKLRKKTDQKKDLNTPPKGWKEPKKEVKNTDKKLVKKTEMHPKKDLNTPPKEYHRAPEDLGRDKPRKTKTRDEKDDSDWRTQTTWIKDEEHSRHVKKSKHDEDFGMSGWRMKEDKKKKVPETPTPKSRGGYPDHPQGMSGGSSVPRKPGPKKPASPAAKRLQRTASRSK